MHYTSDNRACKKLVIDSSNLVQVLGGITLIVPPPNYGPDDQQQLYKMTHSGSTKTRFVTSSKRCEKGP